MACKLGFLNYQNYSIPLYSENPNLKISRNLCDYNFTYLNCKLKILDGMKRKIQ